MTEWSELREDLLRDPEVRAEYERIEVVGYPVDHPGYWRPRGYCDVLAQLAACATMVSEAIRSDDEIDRAIGLQYGLQGMEFELVRAAWLLGETKEAERIHGLVGDHSPDNCPVCVGAIAFGNTSDCEAVAPRTGPDDSDDVGLPVCREEEV